MPQQRDREPGDVGRFLREHAAQILQEWERHARDAGGEPRPGQPAALDELSALIEHVADIAESGVESPADGDLEQGRGWDGLALRRTVGALAELRESIKRLWEQGEFHARGRLRAIHRAIDRAIRESVEGYVEQAQRQTAELEVAIDSMPDAVFVGTAERITRANAAALHILGRERVEDLERPTALVSQRLRTRDVETGVVFPPGRGPFERALAGETLVCDVYVDHQSTGREACLRVSAAPVRLHGATVGAVVVSADITERRRAERAMRLVSTAGAALAASLDVEATLAKITELVAPEVADWCIVDLLEDDGTLRRVSMAPRSSPKLQAAHEQTHEVDLSGDIAGSPLWVARTGEAAFVSPISDDMLVAAAHDAAHLETLRSLALVSYIAVPLAARGRTRGVISMATAESGRRFDEHDFHFAQELARVAAFAVDNARLYQDAQRASKSREEVLAIVSHDLRNPLYAINLAAALLQRRLVEPEADERARRQVETILRSASRMEHLIRSLLDVASIQAGRLVVELQVCDADTIVADAIESQRPIAAVKGVLLLREEPGAQPSGVSVRCDPDRILQVLSNIIDNAVKFCRPGDTIDVSTRRRGRELEIVVSDTGPGIAPEALPHLFDPYWSAAQHAKRGTGLGLYIAKSIVAAHHGRMTVESRIGRGTRFAFTLPIA